MFKHTPLYFSVITLVWLTLKLAVKQDKAAAILSQCHIVFGCQTKRLDFTGCDRWSCNLSDLEHLSLSVWNLQAGISRQRTCPQAPTILGWKKTICAESSVCRGMCSDSNVLKGNMYSTTYFALLLTYLCGPETKWTVALWESFGKMFVFSSPPLSSSLVSRKLKG